MTAETPRLLSTYRLQFHKEFTFDDAAAIVPYLHDLGITHVYASPYFKAVAGSMHGYDVTDHSQLNPEIGDAAAYARFVDALMAHGMSHILDIVPNHVGVDTNDNAWWNDVIRNGRASLFADYFDIDWDAGDQKLLLPVLGEPIGEAIDEGKITIELATDGGSAVYYSRRFPLSPSPGTPGEGRGEGDTGNQDAPQIRNHPHPSPLPEYRARGPEGIDRSLQSQHFRLAHWKVAPDEINYRRFFDVTSLAAIKTERPAVFAATHRFLFELIARGAIAGVRTDHPDGLTDPKAYLVALQDAHKKAVPGATAPLPVWVEKILSTGEPLRADWPVAGTSGYDFLAAVNSLFVDPAAEAELTKVYTDYTGETETYPDIVYSRKWNVLEHALASELTSLTRRLKQIAEGNRHSRDFTTRQLRDALQTVIACFPVYRSYVSAAGFDSADKTLVDIAVERAKTRSPKIAPSAFDFIADAVLQRLEGRSDQTLPFAQKFQQLTSPVTAKGIEDTSFYIFNRLTSLNEVGGDPGRFGCDCADLHAYFADRQQHWPAALSCLSTHDTKRSEDVRARISVLSEIPAEWSAALAEFDRVIPATVVAANDRYLLYQTLVGSWTDSPAAEYVERIQTYMLKAIREAKTRSSWTVPDKAYESAVRTLVENLISSQTGKPFRDAFDPVLKKVAHFGRYNSLSQTLIRLTAPGVPDTYQGTELFDFSLVDPDNRRPVNYARRAQLLAAAEAGFLRSQTPGDFDRAKLSLTRACLAARKAHPDLFTLGTYVTLATTGKFGKNMFAFARIHKGRTAIVAAGRFLTHVGESPTGSVWGDTAIVLPSGCGSLISVFGDRVIPAAATINAAGLFEIAPIALLNSADG